MRVCSVGESVHRDIRPSWWTPSSKSYYEGARLADPPAGAHRECVESIPEMVAVSKVLDTGSSQTRDVGAHHNCRIHDVGMRVLRYSIPNLSVKLVCVDTMNYDGYMQVVRQIERRQLLEARLVEVAEDATGPLLDMPENRRMLILKIIRELAQRLYTVDDDFEMVSPI